MEKLLAFVGRPLFFLGGEGVVAVDRTITFAGLPLFLQGGGDGDGGVNTRLGDLTEGGVGGVGGVESTQDYLI